jgi:Na+/H+-translocating membrane pyrophosphatase
MIEGVSGSSMSDEVRYAFQAFMFLGIVSIAANISFTTSQKYSAESVERDCEPQVLSELSILRDSRRECERTNQFRDMFLPVQHIIQSTGASFLGKETGIFVMFLTWLGLVIFLSLVSARDVLNGHFATLAFIIGGMTALVMAYSIWGFISSVVSIATMGAVYKGTPDAVLQTLITGQSCGEFVTLLTISAFLALSYAISSAAPSNMTDSVSGSLCGVALGISFIAMTMRIASGIFSRASNVGSSLFALETDCNPKANPCFLACLIGDGLSGMPGTALDVSSIIAEAFVAYAAVACCIFELSVLPNLGISLYPLGVLCGGFLCSSLVSRCAQMYVYVYFPASGGDDPRQLKVWMMRLNRTMLLATFALLVPVMCVLAHLTLPNEFAITKLSHDLHSTDNLSGNTAANRHMMILKVTPLLCSMVTLLGAFVGVLVSLCAEGFYGPRSHAVISLVKTASCEVGTLTAQADALGHATILPFVCAFAVAAFIGYVSAGSYGICLVTLGLASLAPLITGLCPEDGSNYYLAHLASLPQPVRALTRALHEVSLGSRALREGYLLTANTFSVVAVWVALGVTFGSSLPDDDLFSSLNVLQPTVVILVILGAGLPNFFAASLGRSISSAGSLIYEEALRILAGTATITTASDGPSGPAGGGVAAPEWRWRLFRGSHSTSTTTTSAHGYQSIPAPGPGYHSVQKDPTPDSSRRDRERSEVEREQKEGEADGWVQRRQEIKFSKRELLRPCSLAAGAALRDALAPALIALMVPVAAGLFFGVLPAFAVLIGSLLSSFTMSIPLLVSGQSLEMVRFCLLGRWESRVGSLPPSLPSEPAIAGLFDTEESSPGQEQEVADIEAVGGEVSSPITRYRHDSQLAAIAEELSGSARTVVAPSLQAQHKVQGVVCLVFIKVFLSINSGRGLFRV